MAALKIEYVPVKKIRPYAGNAKIHTAAQIEKIKRSITEFGFNDPVALWKGEVVEGHGRLIAAAEMGIDKIPVVRLDGLTDEQRRAYALIHNQLTMNTGFDFDVLNEELEQLQGMSMEEYGFTRKEDEEDDDEEVSAKSGETVNIICPKCGKLVAVRRKK